MTYFPDLSPYEYCGLKDDDVIPTVNVGWLDNSKPYPQGFTSELFKEKLFQFCQRDNAILFCLGYHECQFCENPFFPLEVKRGEIITRLGNGEIRVIGQKVIYAAPTMIYHYVVAHNYLPPQEFVDAVLTGPSPASGEHKALVKETEVFLVTYMLKEHKIFSK